MRKRTCPLLIPFSYSIIDGPKPTWEGSIAVSNATEGREAVIRVKKEGAEFLKVYNGLPREAYFAIADEANKQGLPFVGHIPNEISVAEASDAGQKSIEHLAAMIYACSDREEELSKSFVDAISNLPSGGGQAWVRTAPLKRMKRARPLIWCCSKQIRLKTSATRRR